jgi:hypothetical protein
MELTKTSIAEQTNEILVNNGLNFKIEKLPLFAEQKIITKIDEMDATITKSIPTNYYGLLNTKSGNIINTVKDSYTVTQNAEVVEMALRGMQGFGELSVQKAGSINDGRKVFIQLKIEGVAKVGRDSIERYVTIIDSNDGSTGLSIGIGDLTMSCQNQFFKFYKRGEAKFRHTATIADKVKTIPSLIQLALSESLQLIQIYNKFQSTQVSKDLANQLVNELLGFDRTSSVKELSELSTRNMNAMESLYRNIENEINDKGQNLWGLHSGVTRWTTHDKSAPQRENGRIESIMTGTNYKTNQQSFEFAQRQLVLV